MHARTHAYTHDPDTTIPAPPPSTGLRLRRRHQACRRWRAPTSRMRCSSSRAAHRPYGAC